MKKALFVFAAFGAASSFVLAAPTALQMGGLTNLGGETPVCTYVKAGEDAKVQLSNNVVGAYDCTSARAKISTANFKGNAKSYTADSEGGKIAAATASTIGGAQSTFQSAVETAVAISATTTETPTETPATP